MSQVADLYQVLGVPESADAAAIKKAFRSLAKQCHPDTHPGDKKAEDRFKQISQAYDILSDTEKRRRYDAMRQSPFSGEGDGGGGSRGGWQGGPMGGGSIDDLFEMFFGRGRSPFGDMEAPVTVGQDMESEVWASFEDAALGNPITVQMQGREQPLRLNLPPGAESGLRLRLAGQGQSGRRGRPGDLYLTLQVRPSERFTREGLNVVGKAKVNLVQALLGSSITVPTLRGELRLKLAAGTQPGTRLRLAGQGIAVERRKGDHLVEIDVELPKDLELAERQFLGEMAKKRGWEL
jgi:DnaJ-class molecular chaperone